MGNTERITKFLPKSDIGWLESEKERLSKKGWNMYIGGTSEGGRVWQKGSRKTVDNVKKYALYRMKNFKTSKEE